MRVTHGKAARKDGRSPLVKSHVNTWCAAAGARFHLLPATPRRHRLGLRDAAQDCTRGPRRVAGKRRVLPATRRRLPSALVIVQAGTLMSLEQRASSILTQLGEDVNREGLLDTPKRTAKAMKYLCRGYQQSLEEVVNGALFSSDNSEMVLVKDIELLALRAPPAAPSARPAWPMAGAASARLRRRSLGSSTCTPAACRSRRT